MLLINLPQVQRRERTKSREHGLERVKKGNKEKEETRKDLGENNKVREQQRERRGGEKEGRKVFVDDLVENATLHAALSERQNQNSNIL